MCEIKIQLRLTRYAPPVKKHDSIVLMHTGPPLVSHPGPHRAVRRISHHYSITLYARPLPSALAGEQKVYGI